MSIDAIRGFKEILYLEDEEIKNYESPIKKAKINDTAQQVLSKLPTIENRTLAKKFVDKIGLINNKLEGKPLQEIFDKLTTALEQPYKNPQSTLVNAKKTTTVKITTEKHFIKLLNYFDLNSHTINEDINAIKKLILKLEAEKVINSSESLKLQSAVNGLGSNAFSPTIFFENMALDIIASTSLDFKTALERAQPTFAYMRKTELLKYLKSNSIKDINIENLENNLIIERINLVIDSMKNPLDPNLKDTFLKNFPTFLKYLENLYQISSDSFEAACAQGLETLAGNKLTELTEILKNYEFMNPRALTQEVCEKARYELAGKVSFKTLCSKTFKQQCDTRLESFKSDALIKYKEFYNIRFLPSHSWIFKNIPYIKKIYNQGEDTNYNLGEGTCYANSLERHKILWENPKIDIKDIPIRSTNKGRVFSNLLEKYRQDLLASANNTLDHKLKLWSQFKPKMLDKLGLKQTISPQKISSEGSVYDNLWATLQRIQKEMQGGPVCAVCLMHSATPDADGHAINIQIDPQSNIFRIIDDNLGLIEWPDIKNFKQNLCDYLKIFYPDLNKFELEFYTPQ